MMVGDGINDVLVLAAADLSLAVSEASDLAKTNADTLLNNGQLEVILQMLDTGRKTRRIIAQNHAWAIGYNLTALHSAAAGVVEPRQAARSEEHTSELQSRPHRVCRLLLEKKKQ